jgi:hypothetical protein
MKKRYWFLIIFVVLVFLGLVLSPKAEYSEVNRYDLISTEKMTPEMDKNPVKSHSDEYYNPVPLDFPINTGGGEDSSFVMPDGNTLYFFFTPDVQVPVEKQILDEVTGIYVSEKVNNGWSEPSRIWLQDPGKLAGDGCEFIYPDGKNMLFCTVREGYTGIHWFGAEFGSEKWTNWKEIVFPESFDVGELHVYGNELYYHSDRAGGEGGLDIWMIERGSEGNWKEPVNIGSVNSEYDEGWPAISPNGQEMWISREYGVWRSLKINEVWQEPELMFSPLAGEASIDSSGNVYFTHHYFDGDYMIEADIYVAYRV